MTQQTITPEALDQFALARGLSYPTLAKEISAAVGYSVSHAAIFKFCTRRVQNPTRRVLHAVETFMEKQRPDEKKRAKAGRK